MNPAVFAEHGYIVVMPNPTGSTGFGDDMTQRVNANWGGEPYTDLVNCFEYVEKNMPFVDVGRAVAVGGSYGGKLLFIETSDILLT